MKNLNYYFPEMILIQLMVLLFFLRKLHKTVFYFTLVIGLFLIYYFTLQNLTLPPVKLFLGSLAIDSYSSIFKALFIIATMATIYLSQNSTEIYDEIKPQFALLSLGVLLGGMFLVSSNNFLTIYLSIEILSIFSYVLAAIKKNDVKAAEDSLGQYDFEVWFAQQFKSCEDIFTEQVNTDLLRHENAFDLSFKNLGFIPADSDLYASFDIK